MEQMTHKKLTWPVCSIAPVLMRGNIHTDLCKRENWTFASELVFDEVIDENSLNDFGVPFFRIQADICPTCQVGGSKQTLFV